MQTSLVDSLQTLIALVIAYIPVVTLGGYLQARIAHAVGDISPRLSGFMTLDPLQHIHFVGMALLPFLKFGFGRALPMEPEAVTAPHRSLKLLILFMAGAISYFIVLLLAILIATLASFIVLTAVTKPPLYLNSFLQVAGVMAQLSLLLFEVNFFIGIATAFVFFCFPRFYEEFLHSRLFIFVLTLILLLIYGEHIRLLVAYAVGGILYGLHVLLQLITG